MLDDEKILQICLGKKERKKLIKFELFEFSDGGAHNRIKTMRGYGNF